VERSTLLLALLAIAVAGWWALRPGPEVGRRAAVRAAPVPEQSPAPPKSAQNPPSPEAEAWYLLGQLVESRRAGLHEEAVGIREKIVAKQKGEWPLDETALAWRGEAFVDGFYARLGDANVRLLNDAGELCAVEAGVQFDRAHAALVSFFRDVDPGPPDGMTHHGYAVGLRPVMKRIVSDGRFPEEDAQVLVESAWFAKVPPVARLVWETVGRRFPHLMVEAARTAVEDSSDFQVLFPAMKSLLGNGELDDLVAILPERDAAFASALLQVVAEACPKDESLRRLDELGRVVADNVPGIRGAFARKSGYAAWLRRVAREDGSLGSAIDQLVAHAGESGPLDFDRSWGTFSAVTSAHIRHRRESGRSSVVDERKLAELAMRSYEGIESRPTNAIAALGEVAATPAPVLEISETLLRSDSAAAARHDVLIGLRRLAHNGTLANSSIERAALELAEKAYRTGEPSWTLARSYEDLVEKIGDAEALPRLDRLIEWIETRPPDRIPNDAAWAESIKLAREARARFAGAAR